MCRGRSVVVAFGCTLALAGCQTANPYTDEMQTSHTTRGAVIGGAAGGVIGALTNRRNATENALVGAGIGALAGGVVGNYMDRQEAQLRQQLRDSGVSVTRVGNNLHLNMQDDILFELNSFYMHPRAREIARAVATVLREYPQTYVGVNGFTDTSGTRAYNQQLSQRRAEAVADELVRNGVQPVRVTPRGFGESSLRVPTADGVVEPRNRRVEIVLEPYTG